jgi:enoyl-CoA hydratase/carnithine racemase
VVDFEVSDGVAWLTLNRPTVLNALDLATVRRFAACVDEIRVRSDVRVVVTRGAGCAFCAGSDVRELARLAPAEAATAESEHAAAFQQLAALPQPSIALLHGYVLGGGLGIALYHDFRIASDSALLGMPEVELGWTPPWALGRLVDAVGVATAKWLTLTCERVQAEEARALGLVHEVVADGLLTARGAEMAALLASRSSVAVQRTKALLNSMSSLSTPVWDVEAGAAFAACFGTAEARAGVEAFLRR